MVARVGGSYGVNFKGVCRSDAGKSALPQNIQYVVGCGGAALVDSDVGGRGRVGCTWTRG